MGVKEKLKRKITPPSCKLERMSVFRGSITEYPGVIVDHFTAFNCERGRIFFLSHCHKGTKLRELGEGGYHLAPAFTRKVVQACSRLTVR